MGEIDETVSEAVERAAESRLNSIIALVVTALTKKRWLLGVAAVFLTFGFVFGVAGFFGLPLHPDSLMSWLS